MVAKLRGPKPVAADSHHHPLLEESLPNMKPILGGEGQRSEDGQALAYGCLSWVCLLHPKLLGILSLFFFFDTVVFFLSFLFFKLWKHDNTSTGELEKAEQGYI